MFAIEGPGDYRTRDGSKAAVLGDHPYGTTDSRWIGYVGNSIVAWSDKGTLRPDDDNEGKLIGFLNGENERDLIGPWEQPATFALERPGAYRTRIGRKAVVLGQHPYGSIYSRWVGYVGQFTTLWSDTGSYSMDGEHEQDLVGPWEASSTLGGPWEHPPAPTFGGPWEAPPIPGAPLGQDSTLSQLVKAYCDQIALAHPDVTLPHVLRAIAAEIDGRKG